MKRITVEQVKEAYEKTTLKPMQGDYYQTEPVKDTLCACGLGAVYAANHLENLENISLNTITVNKYMDKNYSSDYRIGFVRGFDNLTCNPKCEDDPEVYKAGYEDGVAARKAVLKGEGE